MVSMAEVNMLSSASGSQLPGPPHFVDLHVNSGESVAIQFFDGKETILRGPTTIKMISQHVFPPIPMPVHVPPGHMIQQIVDENGTLRHIILSAINGGDNSLSHSYASSQAQHSPSNYCCCCSAVGNSSQASLVLPLTSQPLQQLSPINAAFFPLNPSSYPRNRRSSRNYPSPNSKRANSNYNANTNYYNTSSTSKVTPSRSYKSDNSKSTYYSRHSSSLSNCTNISRSELNETTKYTCKSYDYSCNSSNASQISIMDQINDNSKYYKEDCYSIEEDVARNSRNDPKTFCFDYNLNANNVEVLSQKLCESSNVTPGLSVNSMNYQANHGVKRSKSSNYSSGRNVQSVSGNDLHEVNLKMSTQLHQHPPSSKVEEDDIFSIEMSQGQSKIHSDQENVEEDNENDAMYVQEELLVLTGVEGDDDDDTSIASISGKSMPNGNLEHYLSAFDETSTAAESDKSESDESQIERHVRNTLVPRIVQQSPKHMLPKIEVLTLSCSCITSSSVRLKWCFNQPNEYADHKKHFIVDLMLANLHDSPNSRMVHQGYGVSCRISHLRPQQEYTFRVRSNSEKAILISNLLSVITPEHPSASSSKASGRRGRQQFAQYQNPQQLIQHQVFEQNHQTSVDQCAVSECEPSKLVRLVCNPLSSDQRNALIILTLFTFFAMFVAVGIQNFLGASH